MSDTEVQVTPLDHAIQMILDPLDRELTKRFGSPTLTTYEYDTEFFGTKVRGFVVRAYVSPSMLIGHDMRAVIADVADAIEAKMADTQAVANAMQIKLKLKKQMCEWESGDTISAPQDITLRHARSLVDTDVATVVEASNLMVLPGEPPDPPNKAMKREQVKSKNVLTSRDMANG